MAGINVFDPSHRTSMGSIVFKPGPTSFRTRKNTSSPRVKKSERKTPLLRGFLWSSGTFLVPTDTA